MSKAPIEPYDELLTEPAEILGTWARIRRDAVADALGPLLDRGLVGTCETQRPCR